MLYLPMSIIDYPLYHVTTTHPSRFDREHKAVIPGTGQVSATFGRTFLEPKPSRVEDNGKMGNLIFAGANLVALIQMGMLFKTPEVFATTKLSDNSEGRIFINGLDGGLNKWASALDHLGAIITIPIGHSSKFTQERDTEDTPIDKYTSTERIPLDECEIEDVNLLELANNHSFTVYHAPEGHDGFSRASGFRFGVGEHINDGHIERALNEGALVKIPMTELILRKATPYKNLAGS